MRTNAACAPSLRAMPTTIHLTDGSEVELKDEPATVRRMLSEDRVRGEPFSMFECPDGHDVFVDPAAVAYFEQNADHYRAHQQAALIADVLRDFAALLGHDPDAPEIKTAGRAALTAAGERSGA